MGNFAQLANQASDSAVAQVENVVRGEISDDGTATSVKQLMNYIASTQATNGYDSVRKVLLDQKIRDFETSIRTNTDLANAVARSVSGVEAKLVTAIQDYKGNDAALAGQMGMLTQKLVSTGVIDAGSFQKNLANLCIHINGVRIDLVPLLLTIPLVRSYKNVVVRQSHQSTDPEDLKSLLYRNDHRTQFCVDLVHQKVDVVTQKVSIKPSLLVAYEAEESLGTASPTRTGMRMVSAILATELITELTPYMDGLVYDPATDLITGTVKATKRIHLLQKEMGEIATTIDLHTMAELVVSIMSMGINKYVGVLTTLFSKDISKYFFGNGARGFLDLTSRA